jgi:hypothetical protein
MGRIVCIIIALAIFTVNCTSPNQNPEKAVFETRIAFEAATHMWARTAADINGNGIKDIVVTNNNAHGGWLGWLETSADLSRWTLHIIADSLTMGGTFAGGDIATGDFNRNGKTDVIGIMHPGEWRAGGAPSRIYWFENPGWTPHFIGTASAFVKDVEVADFNRNGRLEVVVITFESNSLQIFAQREDDSWYEALNMVIPNLHEGMATGDIDGDGYPDIATNGYWLRSPGSNIDGEWTLFNIDPRWNTQTGDWQRNATKVFCADITRNGRAEVFISHSESMDYPVSYYTLLDAEKNQWEEFIIDTIHGCHTLQVVDFNNNGYLDILAGENKMRWNHDFAPVNIYLNSGDGRTFVKQTITGDGCYNCLAADLEDNGYYDIIRTAGHGSEVMEILINRTNR